ncbi:hypothetical protein PVMG_05085 [Plasmodium vivax Mauritania I]|uniref:Uncharacterized protein n=1 Tax=Plasmodium vivax Mauritania I TaxID=1035515 RepID=A0A0J9TK69_PLAVI|nr:hypothetical protein PVMG_05085 [Plasmodium vivax Mauritania I]
MKFNHDRTSSRNFNRFLAKLDSNEELDNILLRGNLVDYGMSSKNTNEEDVISTYGNLKKRRRINLYDHKKGYKNSLSFLYLEFIYNFRIKNNKHLILDLFKYIKNILLNYYYIVMFAFIELFNDICLN